MIDHFFAQRQSVTRVFHRRAHNGVGNLDTLHSAQFGGSRLRLRGTQSTHRSSAIAIGTFEINHRKKLRAYRVGLEKLQSYLVGLVV